MSIQMVAKVLERSESEGNQRLVMISLANYTDDENLAWPSIPRLQHESRIKGKSTVQRALKSLHHSGEIALIRQGARLYETHRMSHRHKRNNLVAMLFHLPPRQRLPFKLWAWQQNLLIKRFGEKGVKLTPYCDGSISDTWVAFRGAIQSISEQSQIAPGDDVPLGFWQQASLDLSAIKDSWLLN